MVDGRLSLNQKTTDRIGVAEAVSVCADAGLGWIGLWRDPVATFGLRESADAVMASGLRVSSLCRGGFFPADNEEQFEANIADNLEALQEAVTLGTDVVVLVCGGIAGGDLDRSRRQVVEGLARIVPRASELGVRLAIEPLHPVFAADRSVVVTMAQALDIAEEHPPEVVGVVVDTFHLWWDPEIWAQIRRAGSRIFSYQVCDYLDPLPDILLGRGMMGDGVIEFRRFTEAVVAAGYEGPIEVEIFNDEIWGRDASEVVAEMIERFDRLVI
ncbi:MAG TPA: sugar phosphate isomerase/epimerase family protein [Acidimicrobiia bacterium]|nr:sugar phosphate isomerase/epimerase family protein [Acidimicrobiia bacterium]